MLWRSQPRGHLSRSQVAMSATEKKIAFLRTKLPDADEEFLLDILISCNGNTKQALQVLGVSVEPKISSTKVQSTLKRFIDPNSGSPKKVRLDVKGETIHIYNSEQLHDLGIPCTMTMNVLPKKQADDMLKFLLSEADTWESQKFYLFERLVESKHTSAMYSEFPERKATYQGRLCLNVRPFTPDLKDARDAIQNLVNKELQERTPGPFQHEGKWVSDFVIANHYPDRQSTVGYHSDQMTHIGPSAIIASYTLGATREFRLRPRHDFANSSVISIHIPHNCLVIMHAGCQEAYKHSIPPMRTSFDPHPIAGQSRMNLTYRMYLPEFKLENIPKCRCNNPMILRTTKSKDLKYIWQCSSTYLQEKGCGETFFPNFSTDDPTGVKHIKDLKNRS